MRLTPYCLAILLCGLEFTIAARPATAAGKKTLPARFVADAPVLDGILDEKVWTEAEAGTGFVQREPDTGKAASQRTEVRVIYTATTLYVGLYAYDSEAHRIIDKEMQRDQPLWRDDAIDVVLDTFGDHRNAYLFETNPNGARTDALITDEGRDFNISWNGVWEVASRRTAEGWFAEMAISTELELPVVTVAGGAPPLPEVFGAVWADLAQRGWTGGDFCVTRDHPREGLCISSNQAISTDTGPVPADYYRYRTPRPAYDYAISERGWRHWTIVDRAAVQELVDVTFEDAPRAVRLLHRLTGLMNFVLRNDPGIHGHLEKVVVENRGTSTQPPGEELVSLALVSGLLANLDEATEFSRASPYAFWIRLLDESTRLPLHSVVLGRSVPDLLKETIAIARRGLVRRGEPAPDAWLAPLLQRIEDGASPADRRLRELRHGGTAEMIRNVRFSG